MSTTSLHVASFFHRLRRESETAHAASELPALGQHVLGDFLGCTRLPDDADRLQELMEEAATMLGATVIESCFHTFNPHGLSGVVVISESHMAIHTWPEHDAACVDLFTCSTDLHPRIGFEWLAEQFGATDVEMCELPRGLGVPRRLMAESASAIALPRDPKT